MQPYLIVIIVVLSVFALLFVFAFLCEKIAFGKRCDKNPKLKYFTAKDFGLEANPVELENGLKGFVYSKQPQSGKTLIFCHGMGPGHIAYTTEIAYFCNKGYTVLAVDSRGCNFSEGKNLKVMYSGVKTAVAAIDFARRDENLKNGKIYLVGHSWGAYSALCASAKRKVDGVVALSAPDTPSKTMQCGATSVISKPFAAVLRPFWWLLNLCKYGAKGNSSASASAVRNGTPTLLIHGDKDNVVPKGNAAYFKAKGENVKKLLVNERGHNPYNTQSAEKLLAELLSKLKKGEDLTAFDFTAATEEDEKVMSAITEFIENN